MGSGWVGGGGAVFAFFFCCFALFFLPFLPFFVVDKSMLSSGPSLVSASSQRYSVCLRCLLTLCVEGTCVPWSHVAGGTFRTPNLKSVESVREVVVCTGGVACVGHGTSLSWNPCWLVDPSRLKGTSFPTPEDDRRCYESDASAVHRLRWRGWTDRMWNCRMS